jgi:hypothetical protein
MGWAMQRSFRMTLCRISSVAAEKINQYDKRFLV